MTRAWAWLLVAALAACAPAQPQCACGHVEIVHRKAYTTHSPVRIGKVTTMQTRRHPARDVRVFVCDRFDQWEETR